jgi:hypothetical protein
MDYVKFYKTARDFYKREDDVGRYYDNRDPTS